MRYTLAYKVKIKNKQINKILSMTLDIYREALSYCVAVFNDEYDNWNTLKGKQRSHGNGKGHVLSVEPGNGS